MAFGYTKAPNKYIVKWQEIVTFEVEVEAYSEDEAHNLALKGNQYSNYDQVDCDYWEGSLEITLEEEGEVEEDPDYGYKLSMEEDVEDDPHYPQAG